MSDAPKKLSVLSAVIALGILGLVVWYFVLGGMEKQTADTMQGINNQVAADFTTRYEISKRSGSPMDACVAAGLAAARALQAKNEDTYKS